MFSVSSILHPAEIASYNDDLYKSSELTSRLLIPLNKCRHQTLYQPWKCEDERHGYEK